jgi:hypothetical protein
MKTNSVQQYSEYYSLSYAHARDIITYMRQSQVGTPTICYSPLFHIRYYPSRIQGGILKNHFWKKRNLVIKDFDNLFVACCLRRQVVFAHDMSVICVNKTFVDICNPIYSFINNTIFIIALSFRICQF